MNNTETAKYISENYSRQQYILLTLVSCSLLLNKVASGDVELPPEIDIINDSLNSIRESLSETELAAVSAMMGDLDRISNGDVHDTEG